MSRTAIVILNFNGEKLLRDFLPSVIKHSPEAQIIIADNSSSDQSIQFVRNTFPDVRVIQLDKNYGYCGGYNRALRQIDADYFVLLNSDIEVTDNWLKPMIDVLDHDASVAAVQPKILSYANKTQFEHAGAGGGFIDSLGYPFCRGRVFDHVEHDKGQYNDTREIFWASGACLTIRSESFKKFAGFDEDFFAHMEEIDLCWKIHRTGKKVFFCGGSTIYHVGAGTLAYRNPKKTYLNFRNGLSLLLNHLDPGELFYKLMLRILFDWVAALQFLFKGELRNFAAILRAHGSFVLNLPRDYSKRTRLRKSYPTYDNAMIYKGSIVIDYYLRGKKEGYAPASHYRAPQHV